MRYDYIAVGGMPRSGTTILCKLLNTKKQLVALDEPIEQPTVWAPDREEAARQTLQFFDDQWKQLRDHGTAWSKTVAGRVGENHFAKRSTGGWRRYARLIKRQVTRRPPPPKAAVGKQVRSRREKREEVAFEHFDRDAFRLCLKHPALFTAILPELCEEISCYAMVRSPIDTICSWSTVQAPFREGRSPTIEAYHPQLTARLDRADSGLHRQVVLYRWILDRVTQTLPANRVIQYEPLLESQGAILGLIDPVLGGGSELISRKAVTDYGGEVRKSVEDAISRYDPGIGDAYRSI